MKIFDELEGRGLIKQTTNTEKLRTMLNDEQVTFYIGFDPTADSLHVGHLLQLITMKRLVKAGHKAIAIVGNGTAQVGDPSGKNEMRKMLTPEVLNNNTNALWLQINKIVEDGEFKIHIANNFGWLGSMKWLEVLREVGPHLSVNNMLRADCFKSRMEHGLSFLEFNYMVMQAMDFLRLNEWHRCTLQIGGDDQWSNILAGIDLIHKIRKQESFGITLPLLLNSDGTKMGKTEKGAVWLDSEKTSVFDFFQFWRNIPDLQVLPCFRMLTFLSFQEIMSIPFNLSPEQVNAAKKKLAFEITKIVHGEEAASEALRQAEALFESRDSSAIEATSIEDGIQLLDLLVQGGFAKSRTDARNLIKGRGIAINDEVIDDPTLIINRSHFGDEVLIKKGKKNFGRFVFKDANEKTRICNQRGP